MLEPRRIWHTAPWGRGRGREREHKEMGTGGATSLGTGAPCVFVPCFEEVAQVGQRLNVPTCLGTSFVRSLRSPTSAHLR